MIETWTTWDDSGYDCDHCGRKIFRRTDHETGQSPQVYYQCRNCGCQWTLDGESLRIGRLPQCKTVQRQRYQNKSEEFRVPVWAWIVLGIVLLMLISQFGGLVALRLLVPLALGGVALIYAYRYGREREWW